MPVKVEPAPNAAPAAGTRSRDRRGKVAIWLGIFGVALLLCVLRWNSYRAPLIRDEGEYAYSAQLLRYGLAPYEQAFLQKPPMVVYTYALAHFLAPNTFWFPRVLAAGFIGIATVLMGIIARLEFAREVAFPAVWFFTPMVLLPGLEEFTANTEMFMVLPLLGLLTTYAFGRRRGSGPGTWFAAGCLGAITFWYKYTALPLLSFVYAAWAFEEWRSGKRLPVLVKSLGSGIAGALVTSVAVLAFFLVRDGGRGLWECTIQFNRFYAGSINFGLAALGEWVWLFFKQWWILFLLPWAVFLKPNSRLWFWLGAFFASWLTTVTSYYGQYYILPMVFWSLLSAVSVKNLSGWLAERFSLSRPWMRRGLTAGVVGVLCWPAWPWLILTPEQFAAGKLGTTANPFLEAPFVARRVAELTTPQDRVFVGGSEPEILSYAQRFSSTRFVITAPLMIPSPVAAGYQDEVIRELTEKPPALIVLVRPNSSWLMEEASPRELPLFLVDFLATNYHRIGGCVTAPKLHWEEPLAESNVLSSSLIIFRNANLR